MPKDGISSNMPAASVSFHAATRLHVYPGPTARGILYEPLGTERTHRDIGQGKEQGAADVEGRDREAQEVLRLDFRIREAPRGPALRDAGREVAGDGGDGEGAVHVRDGEGCNV